MSIKYEKWRDLLIDPLNIEFKNVKLIDMYSYPGAQNDVIECNCIYNNEKIKCFVKIERSKMACFSEEIKNINMLCKKNLYDKCPKILESGAVNNKNYIVLKKIEGLKLSEIFKQNKKIDIKKYLINYGRELAIIHKIPMEGFETAKQRIINDIPNQKDYKVFDNKIIKYINILLETKQEYKMDTFIHGDFHYANILWNNNDITGVLDFEYSGIGFKEQDIAWAIVLRPGQKFLDNIDDINTFLSGYKQINSYNGKLLKWCLINAYCHFYVMNSDSDYKRKIIKLLNTISKLQL